MTNESSRNATRGYQLRFHSLGDCSPGFAFPCNALGQVELDTLSDRARIDYLYVRALVGRDFAAPAITPE